jgi:hypothetical protein
LAETSSQLEAWPASCRERLIAAAKLLGCGVAFDAFATSVSLTLPLSGRARPAFANADLVS